MDDSLESRPRRRQSISMEHKTKLRQNAAKAREVRSARIAEKKKGMEFGDGANELPGEGAVDILRRVLMILSSRYSDGRMDKRSCVMCEMRVPRDPPPGFVNTCPCQEGWRYVDHFDRAVQEQVSGERHKSA